METLNWKLSGQANGRSVIDAECIQRGLSTFGVRTKHGEEVARIGGRDDITEFATGVARRVDRRAMDMTSRAQVTQVDLVVVKREVVEHDYEFFPVNAARKSIRVQPRNAIAIEFHFDLGLVDVMAKEERRNSYCCGINHSTTRSLRGNHGLDNALLLACHDFSGQVLMGCKVVAAGAVIGCAWWLLVALRAGALS